MSAHPGVASPRRRISVAGPVLALCSLLVFAACDSPESPEALAGPQYSQPVQPTSKQCPSSGAFYTGGAQRSVDVAVTLADGTPAAGVVATLIHPTAGPKCWAETDANGLIRFTRLSTNAAFYLSLRDDVSGRAPELEVSPAHPNQAAITAFAHDPRPSRQAPLLVSGAACTDRALLTWQAFSEALGAPCVVTNQGLAVAVPLQMVTNSTIEVVDPTDPDNTIQRDVLVAGISTAFGSIATECTKMPWLNPADCADPTKFSGPGLLQAMNVLKMNVPERPENTIDLGLARGAPIGGNPAPFYIEAIAQDLSGFTLFGTALLAPSGTTTVYLQPGMCSIETVGDDVVPSGSSALNIQKSSFSVGLKTGETAANDPNKFPRMTLLPVPTTLVVSTVIDASSTGGTGQFDLQYRRTTGGNLVVRMAFSILNGECSVETATGSGIAVLPTGYCSETGLTAEGRKEFTLFFVMSNMPTDFAAGEYTIKADKDNHPDASRSDPHIARGAVQITPYVEPTEGEKCPVNKNNDGRWLIV